jgi:hypothetical protein
MSSGWLIEKHVNSELRYWGGRATDHFTNKQDEAVRFAREADASLVLAWLCGGQGRAVEHLWRDEPPKTRTVVDHSAKAKSEPNPLRQW